MTNDGGRNTAESQVTTDRRNRPAHIERITNDSGRSAKFADIIDVLECEISNYPRNRKKPKVGLDGLPTVVSRGKMWVYL